MNLGTQPRYSQSCPQCGGQCVFVECHPTACLVISLFSTTRLQALSCTNCGYTTLYAQEPKKLRKLLPGQR